MLFGAVWSLKWVMMVIHDCPLNRTAERVRARTYVYDGERHSFKAQRSERDFTWRNLADATLIRWPGDSCELPQCCLPGAVSLPRYPRHAGGPLCKSHSLVCSGVRTGSQGKNRDKAVNAVCDSKLNSFALLETFGCHFLISVFVLWW